MVCGKQIYCDHGAYSILLAFKTVPISQIQMELLVLIMKCPHCNEVHSGISVRDKPWYLCPACEGKIIIFGKFQSHWSEPSTFLTCKPEEIDEYIEKYKTNKPIVERLTQIKNHL